MTNDYNPVQKYNSPTQGQLHRCRLCVGVYFDLHGVPQVDNGYVPQTQNPHYYDNCQYNTGWVSRWVTVSETPGMKVSYLPEHKDCTDYNCSHHYVGVEEN